MSAVYRRELKSLFSGMIAPLFITLLLLMCGIYSVLYNFADGDPRFEFTVPSLGFIFLLIVPLLTMQSFASEKAAKTDQALYSLPLSTVSVVVGKYFAMVSVLGISAAAMCVYPLIMTMYGDVYFPTVLASILAFFLMGCSLIAIGMFISTLTESQVIAAVVSIGVFLLLYMISYISSLIPSGAAASFAIFLAVSVLVAVIVAIMTKNYVVGTVVGAVLVAGEIILYFVKSSFYDGKVSAALEKLGVFDQMANFVNGIFDVKTVVYYLSIVFLFVFMTGLSFDKKRWN